MPRTWAREHRNLKDFMGDAEVTTPHGDLAAILAPEYEVLRQLGVGAMATVHLARDPALRRLVAIKVPLPDLARDALVRLRFEREARAAARITHPNAATIHRIGRLPDGTPYMVMEYVEGRTLAQALLAEGPLPPPVAVRVLSQVASALEAAHRNGVIHRDLRPSNVLWEAETGRAVLSDFGIAGILETGSEAVTRLTTENQQLGDPGHVSPEQLIGQQVTEAADIYSFGVLAYEVLTQQRPYRAETREEIAAAHLRQPPRDLAQLMENPDPQLRQLLMRCLAKNPEHRPTAASVVRTLGRIRGGQIEGGAEGVDPLSGAVQGLPALAAFLSELRRRRVYNVLIVYVAAAFFLLQLADLILRALPLPDWSYTFLVAVTVGGFPVALVLAWLFDVTAAGIQLTEAGTEAGSSTRVRVLAGLALTLTLLLAALIGRWILQRH